MKRLVFKKWVEYLVGLILITVWFIVAAFEHQTFTPYLIGLSMMIISALLLAMFGRND